MTNKLTISHLLFVDMHDITRTGKVITISTPCGDEYIFIDHGAQLAYIGPLDRVPKEIARRVEEYADKEIMPDHIA